MDSNIPARETAPTSPPVPPPAPPPVAARPRRYWPWAMLALLVAAAVWQYPALKEQAEAGSAYAARIGCSCRYVQGRPLDSCTTDFEPGMEIVSISDDPATRTVTGSVPLLASRSARFAGASGCLLVAE